MKTFSKFLLFIIALMLVALVAQAQSTVPGYVQDKEINDAKISASSFNASQNDRKFAIVEYYDKVAPMDSFLVTTLITDVKYIKDGSVTYRTTPADTATLYIAEDPARPLRATMTWKYADQIYDTTFNEKERIDDPAGAPTRWGVVNMSKYTNTTKPGVYNKTFSAVTTTASVSSAKITTTGDVFEFFGERFDGHGNIKIFIDGQQVQTLYQGAQPWVTDFSRMQPSFRWIFPKATPTSAPGEHTIEIQTDPANQYIIDFLRVLNYTLKPR